MSGPRKHHQPGTTSPRREPGLVIATLVLVGVILTVIAVVTLEKQPLRAIDKAPKPTPVQAAQTTLTQVEVQPVHDALHDIAARCRPGTAADDPRRVAHDAAVFMSFALRYPRAEFSIDDERGTTLSLLLVARQALTDCAPGAAAQIDRLLPTEYRKGLEPVPPKPSPTVHS